MATKYWIGGTGNWSDTANWSASSGGAGGEVVPSSLDDVIITSTSGSGTISIDVDATAKSISISFSASNIIIDYAANLTVSGDIVMNAGTWRCNSYNTSCVSFSTENTTTRVLNLGSGVFTLSGAWSINDTTNLTITASTSTIVMAGATKSFAGAGLTYNVLECKGTPISISGNNTFNTIIMTPGKTVRFSSNSTQTVSNLTALGTAANVITIIAVTAGTAATITKSGGGTVQCAYLSLKDSIASPANTFYASDSSVVSNVSGWTLGTAPDPVVVRATTAKGSFISRRSILM